MRESTVKWTVTEILKQYKAYYFYPVANTFTRAGIPDIIVCFHGQFIAIECKANGNTCTKLQKIEQGKIRDAGGITLVIDEHNLFEVEKVLNDVQSRAEHRSVS